MIQVYTGNGKGKTTAAIGLGIRAVGAGKKVLLVQFLKTEESSELKVLKEINSFDFKCFGRPGVIRPEDINEEDAKLVAKGIEFVEKNADKYNVVILDEINVVLSFNLASIKSVMELLDKFKDKEIILTGRNAPEEIVKKADLVTEFKEVKHYFKKGVMARKGIEF